MDNQALDPRHSARVGEEDWFPARATVARLREFAKFYGERPCVELGKTPTLREISQGECADACVLFDAAADEVERLRLALAEIAKGEGAFSRDQLTHAKNTIDSMKQIARGALGTEQTATTG